MRTLILSLLLPVVVVGCQQSQQSSGKGNSDVHSSLAPAKAWVNSLSGLTLDEVKQKFGSANPKQSTWSSGDISGTKIEYEFRDYTVELYCSNDEVVLASINIYPGATMDEAE